jgi:hypothetical protein
LSALSHEEERQRYESAGCVLTEKGCCFAACVCVCVCVLIIMHIRHKTHAATTEYKRGSGLRICNFKWHDISLMFSRGLRGRFFCILQRGQHNNNQISKATFSLCVCAPQVPPSLWPRALSSHPQLYAPTRGPHRTARRKTQDWGGRAEVKCGR